MSGLVRICIFYVLFTAAWILHIYGLEDVKYIGCYREIDFSKRLLGEYGITLKKSMTIGICLNICKKQEFRYAGVEWSVECFCSNKPPPKDRLRDEGFCNYTCSGDETQICGGNGRISVFDMKGLEDIKYMGCYKDLNFTDRLLGGYGVTLGNSITLQACLNLCEKRGFRFAGVELGVECFCSNKQPLNKHLADEGDCNYKCKGDQNNTCGGNRRINVFDMKGLEDIKYIGCYRDINFSNRLLGEYIANFSNSMTIGVCLNICKKQELRYAGVEWSMECFCSNKPPSKNLLTDEGSCNYKCSGDETLICGGNGRINIFDMKGLEDIKYMGCYKDLNFGGYGITLGSSITPKTCWKLCKKKTFRYAGVDSGVECYCSNERPSYHHLAHEGECNYKCEGDQNRTCGGNGRINVVDLKGLEEKVVAVDSKYIGCFMDPEGQMLNTATMAIAVTNIENYDLVSPEQCVDYCYSHNLHYAGLPDGDSCSCGDDLRISAKVDNAKCSTCEGEKTYYKCGGNKLLSVYHTGTPGVVDFKYMGCYKDLRINARLLREYNKTLEETMTANVCLSICKKRDFRYAGVEVGTECFCSNERPSYQHLADEDDCNHKCSGDESQTCGGNKRITVFDMKGLKKRVNTVDSLYVGCFMDSAERMLNMSQQSIILLTPELCVGYCFRRGYRFAGLELGKECYCGDTLRMSAKVDDAKCSAKCEGEKSFKCGGVWLLSVYHTGIPDLPENENLIGCYNDNFKTVKLLTAARLELHQSNTPKRCMNICLSLGHKYAGTEFRYECYCGNKRPPVESEAEENECYLSCPGNPKEFCGGNQRILVYSTGFGKVDTTIPEIKINTKQNAIPPDFPTKVEAEMPQSPIKCELSVTTVNGKNVCLGELIFTEDFSSKQLDIQKWGREIYMPSFPDYEFVTFTDSPQNTYIKNGKLYIKPTVMEDNFVKTGKLELRHCTGKPFSEDCSRQGATYNILPPIQSGKLSTKDFFSFKYGIVQIEAKLPVGDWILPEILLEPKRNSYGSGYSSGKVRIAMARGNRYLTLGTSDIGNNKINSGVIMAHQHNTTEQYVIRGKRNGWHDRFHNFTFVWTPENFAFLVDGSNEGKLISAEGNHLCRIVGFDDRECETWKGGTPLAPFDKEFYLSIGLSVGGMRDFPDGSISGNTEKPWKNFHVKAMAYFWKDRESWLSTWNDEESALQVDSIRIYAV